MQPQRLIPSEASSSEPASPIIGVGIMEKNMETTIVYRGYIGIMEKKMETTRDLSLFKSKWLIRWSPTWAFSWLV